MPGASRQLSNESNLAKQIKNILQHSITSIENLINDNFENDSGFQLSDNAFEYNKKRIRKAANRLQHRSASIDNYFIVLYLFSLLISADKIDAGEVKTFEPSPIVPDLVDKYLSVKKNSSLVDIRNKARGNIENKLDEIDIIEDKLFTITAPTGRDIGPLDSIIQVAGRINRNEREGFKNSPLYVVYFENDAQRVYGRIIINASLKINNSNKEYFLECEYLNLIQDYYNLIAKEESTSFEESIKLYDAMQKLRFTKDEYEEETAVEDFKLIDDNKAHYSDVFIPITKNATTVLNIYINGYLESEDMNEKKQTYIKIKSSFNQYKLSVPNHILNYLVNNSNGIDQLVESKLYMINKEYIGKYNDKKHNILYNYETGFCREEIEPEILIF